jgi:hypothetical protein
MPRLDRGILFRGQKKDCPVKPGNDENLRRYPVKPGNDDFLYSPPP